MTNDQFNEAFSEEKRAFTFILEPRNWLERILFQLGLKEKVKQVYISPITLGARSRYSKYALRLDIDKAGKGVSLTRAGNQLSAQYIDDLIMAIAVVLHNKESAPPAWMIKELRKLTQVEIDGLLLLIARSIDTTSFLNSIILINGMSLQTEEIIASDAESPGDTK